ncbi:PspC domain-containing protein [Nibribacter koreensis]|uniref:Phage shock protein C (PspC) family protein n=1 Tax=Nibribacter koreensis TaxID=1084519 RepID=A0ABP8FEP8_9BACT
MKKNISVNLQGMIFHVEEDGYEMLSQYLAAIKRYFSTYEGHEEIVADIESRIAEIFFSRLNPGKQVITQEDVKDLILQMGTVTDFQMEEREETESAYSHSSTTGNTYQQAPGEQKRLYRDVNRKVLAGVAAGIANYLQTDPLWVRLAFVFLVIGIPFSGGITLFGVILYIICWIALPENAALPETQVRKLFRDPVDKKLGGVASGIAIYFGADVAIIRLLFVIFAIFGIGLLIYIVLWIAVPEAKSITERVQMQGNPVTLSSIEESVKNNLNMRDANGEESTLAKILLFPVRLVSQVISVLSRLLHPVLGFLITMIRVVAGLFMIFLGGTLAFALFIGLATALGSMTNSSLFEMGDIPATAFFNGVPTWVTVAGFFAGIIPAIALILIGVGLLARRFFIRPTVGWSMLGIWLLSVVMLISGIAMTSREFQEYGEFTKETTFPAATLKTINLNLRESNYDYGDLDIEIEGYNGTDIKVIQTFQAQGFNEENAIANARMISYKLVQQNDSTIRFDDAFTFNNNAIFRAQDLDIKILVPEGKQIRFSEGFASQFGYEITDGDYYGEDVAENLWQMKNGRLVCVSCSVIDNSPVNASDSLGVARRNDMALGDDLEILNGDYDGTRKVYKVGDFNEVVAAGAYHIRIKQSYRHFVRVQGNDEELDKLRIREQNGVLKISREGGSFFKLWDGNKRPILIEIETPDLQSVDLSGAIKSEIFGFAPEDFTLNMSGATEVAMNINTSNLKLDLSGASQLRIKGSADYMELDASGACGIQAPDLVTDRADVDLSGASQALVNVQRVLNADASGASNIEYVGNAELVNRDQSGGSQVRRRR